MNIILPDGFGDWRIETVVKVRGDQVLAGGQIAKDGTLGWKTTITEDKLYGSVTFPTPNPIALILDISLRSSLTARSARKSITYPKLSVGGAKTAEVEQASPLYEYFENCMVAAVFAFQSLEIFANSNIWNKAKEPLTIQRDGKERTFPLDQLERRLSTYEKVSQVLPQLFQKEFDPKSDLWKRFENLKKVRDSIVHLKANDHYVRWKIDKDSVYYNCLKVDPIDFPAVCVSLMRFFINRGEQRWLDAVEDYLKAAATV